MTLSIVRVQACTDNYIWLLHDVQSGKIAAVDQGHQGQEGSAPWNASSRAIFKAR
jgi:hypothetical protein